MLNPLAFESFKAKAIACLALLVAGALLALSAVLWVHRYGQRQAEAARQEVTQRYEAALLAQKVLAAKELAEAVSRVTRMEASLADAQRTIEEMGHDRQALSADYQKRFDLLAARNDGRLRDPNATGCGAGDGGAPGQATAPAGAGATGGAQAGGLVSAELTQLLLTITRSADEVNDAYAVCRQDALNLRRQLAPQ